MTDAIYFKFLITRGRPFLQLRSRAIPATAQRLHTTMYSALAAGDLPALRTTCCASLLSTFESRVAARPANQRLVWRLHRYVGKPRVLMQRCAKLPFHDSEGRSGAVRQAVVRVKSVQSLERWRERKGRDGRSREVREDKEGEQGEGDQGREITEYLVVQQRMWKGKQEEWMVWGTMEEASVAEVMGDNGGGGEEVSA
ncbi:MAG: hypothetical protein M1822_000927 [Bathelium mastoideum]|nr:MAG: hypothetical protein M1822_000927 [Bathelium mastoideum]